MPEKPDWIYRDTGGGTFSTPWGEFAYDAPMSEIYGDPSGYCTDIFHVGAAGLPMQSRLARFGVKGVLQQMTDEGKVSATVMLRRGLPGWITRRWIQKHPLKLIANVYRLEWGEWREQIGTVHVESGGTNAS